MENDKIKEGKKWLTLNAHGKRMLKGYCFALSSNDITTKQLDYLYDKGLVDYTNQVRESIKQSGSKIDVKDRIILAGHCLTDLGLETVRHYLDPTILPINARINQPQ